jgi:hypothetical protein
MKFRAGYEVGNGDAILGQSVHNVSSNGIVWSDRNKDPFS